MKPSRKTSFPTRARIFLITVAVFALSNAQTNATDQQSVSPSTRKKLDPQLVLALKKMRGESPFDKTTALEPDIPFKHNGRVLVDLDARVSRELVNRIVRLGGWVDNSLATTTTLRAMVPFSQLETLAARADVKSISPARPTHRSGAKASTTR
jgi:hypothetical protein